MPGGGWSLWSQGLDSQHLHCCTGATAANGVKGALGQGTTVVPSDLGRMGRADGLTPLNLDSSSLQVDGIQGSLTRQVQKKSFIRGASEMFDSENSTESEKLSCTNEVKRDNAPP